MSQQQIDYKKKYEYDYQRTLYLANTIYQKHYQKIAPDWEPLDDIAGLITQIDNMICGLNQKNFDYDYTIQKTTRLFRF